ncbi:hypothetical protein ACIRLA_22085 [Streptomyces sp. NPDC102364]|uniref:hypothetical protein n=1 Tax=Streptomyces sp. NPDC102364 TaxID=3366161 RepID=UPI00381EF936
MDIDRLMTRDGMRDYTDGQRETWVNDVSGVDTLAQVVEARLAQTEIKGDGRRSAKRRARKVAKRFRKASRLVREAAAEIEAANAVFVREVVELPERRAEALERKKEREQRREQARALASGQAAGALAESAHGFNTDPQCQSSQVIPPVPQSAPLLNPQPFAMPQSSNAPPGEITDYFPRIDLPEAM